MKAAAGGQARQARTVIIAAAVLALLAATVLLVRLPEKPEAGNGETVSVELDGKPWSREDPPLPGNGDLRVYITLDGAPLMDLPFEEAHTVRIRQADGGQNTVTLTGSAVMMSEADCEGQDCVRMGEVTRDNLEFRVMSGFIICLPHRLSVEVRSRD